ncbi:MAG TPA: S8 family peptidase, partial [Gemmatimonadales bacterium]|nr:S8 family peptidase [Gemmatimonadales bacterium]
MPLRVAGQGSVAWPHHNMFMRGGKVLVRKKVLAVFVGGMGLLAACYTEPPASAPTEQSPAPLLAVGQNQIPDRYIVVFKSAANDVDRTTEDVVRGSGAQVHYRYRAVIHGFAATIPAAALEGIRRNPNVEYVEPDGVAQAIVDSQYSTPSWGIDRIDQQALPLNSAYAYNNQGAGVRVYILDTGIRYTHEQYAGRAVTGWDYIGNDNTSEECHGHGTHVAGTVGGTTTGVAKQVTLVGIRVLDCSGSGSYSGIIAAVDSVTREQAAFPGVKFVGNMSLGGPSNASLNSAVNNSVNQGVVWALAAGNDYAVDACTKSPAGATNALTVGATGSNDARASFSNVGTCVDLFAPGVGITSSVKASDTSYESWSGT